MQLRVIFCVAGGHGVGMGHVLRSLTLASALEKNGIGIVGLLCDDAISQGVILASGRAVWGFEDESLSDADVMIVDCPNGLGLDIRNFQKTRPKMGFVALDSFDMEQNTADVVINLINHNAMHQRPVSPRVNYYEGVEFAIIRDEFLAARQAPARSSSAVRKLIVSFGGSDPANHTGLVLNLLGKERLLDITVKVIIGDAFREAAPVCELARSLGFEVLEKVRNLAPHFAAADLAISGGGTTMLELACVGTPTLVLPQNILEARFAASLSAKGVVCLSSPEALRRDLKLLLLDKVSRQRMHITARECVDGLGCCRIASLLLQNFNVESSEA